MTPLLFVILRYESEWKYNWKMKDYVCDWQAVISAWRISDNVCVKILFAPALSTACQQQKQTWGVYYDPKRVYYSMDSPKQYSSQTNPPHIELIWQSNHCYGLSALLATGYIVINHFHSLKKMPGWHNGVSALICNVSHKERTARAAYWKVSPIYCHTTVLALKLVNSFKQIGFSAASCAKICP